MTDLSLKLSALSLPPGPLTDAYLLLKDLYVENTPHTVAQESLQRLVTAGATQREHRGLLLIGPSGSGKTRALSELEKWIANKLGLKEGATKSVASIEITSDARPKGLVSATLQALGDPLFDLGTQNNLERRLAKIAPAGKHAIALDEFHHTFVGKTAREKTAMAQTTKNIATLMKMPMILAGVNGLEDFIDSHAELKTRFPRRVYFPEVNPRRKDSMLDLRRLLVAVDKILPMEPGMRIDSPEMIFRVIVGGMFSFGRIVELLQRACEIGAINSAPFVGMGHFAQAYRESVKEDRRADENNPFLMPQELVNQLGQQPRRS